MPDLDQEQFGRLIDFLARDEWVDGKEIYDADRCEMLRNLPIWITSSGNLVSLSGSNVYQPGGFDPPPTGSQLKMIYTGQDGRWKRLLNLLRVETLDRATFTRKCLIPYFANLGEDEQYSTLRWLRSNLALAEQEAAEATGKALLGEEILSAPLIRCSDSQLRAVREVYNPDEKVIQDVFGVAAPMPDKDYFGEDWDRWSIWFGQLGWRTAPEPTDIIAHVDRLIERSKEYGPDSAAGECMNVYYHVTGDWDRYAKLAGMAECASSNSNNYNIGRQLSIRAWLPALAVPEELRRFPLAAIPEPRLYRADELCFVQDANLVASSRPLFRVRNQPSENVRSVLGFRKITTEEVASHFEALIALWEQGAVSQESDQTFQVAIKRVYNYFYDNIVAGQADGSWLRDRFSKRECLWDYGKFWRADHAFQTQVPFFGNRRTTIKPEERTAAVYRLLGQKERPTVTDFIDFLVEIYKEFESRELPAEIITHVIEVCKRLAAELTSSEDNSDLTRFVALTAGGRLLSPYYVLVPDASWRVPYVQAAKGALLHPEIPQGLALAAGCLSLLHDVVEKPNGEVELCVEAEPSIWVDQWENTINSNPLAEGIVRLFYHQTGQFPKKTEALVKACSIQLARQILVDLVVEQDGRHIASGVDGDHYWNERTQTLYVSRADRRVMLHSLTEAVNHHLLMQPLPEIALLRDILDESPDQIHSLLNRYRVASYTQVDLSDLAVFEDSGITDSLFDDDLPSDDDAERVETPKREALSCTTDSMQAEGLDSKFATDASGQQDSSEARLQEDTQRANNSDVNKDTTEEFSKSNITTPSRSNETGTGDEKLNNGSEVGGIAPSNNDPSSDLQRTNFSESGRTSSAGPFLPKDKNEEEDKTSSSHESANSDSARSQSDGASRIHPGDTSRTQSGSRSEYSDAPNRTRDTKDEQRTKGRQGSRLRSYVFPTDNDKETDHDAQQKRSSVGRKGEERVFADEVANGRSARRMAHLNPGFDIQSADTRGEIERYIEVKSLSGYWGETGVGLTNTQFKLAQELGDRYWLYVVECAEDDKDYNIIRIQNPAQRVNQFLFDDGWRDLGNIEEHLSSDQS